MAMAETANTLRATEALTFRVQVPMVIPKEIRDLKPAGQLPAGNIAYFDFADPDTLRFVDQETWRPVTKKGVEARISIDKAVNRFAGIILHSPARTPENSLEDKISQLSALLKRTSKREEGITTQQNLGVLFIVEDKGEDQRIGWRQEQLTRNGLVVDTTRGESVRITDSSIISWGRRPKQHAAVDLTKGERSQHMINPFIQAIEDAASNQGFTADTTRLRQEARATRFPPRTIANLRDGRNVVYEGADDSGKRILVDRSRTGSDFVSPGKEVLQRATQQQRDEKKPSKIVHKPGDIVDLDLECWDCPDGYFREEYHQEAGRVRWLLKKDVVCHGSHSDGHPVLLMRNEYVGFLDLLPPDLRKKDSHLV